MIHYEWPRIREVLQGSHEIHRDEGNNGNSDHDDHTRHTGDLCAMF